MSTELEGLEAVTLRESFFHLANHIAWAGPPVVVASPYRREGAVHRKIAEFFADCSELVVAYHLAQAEFHAEPLDRQEVLRDAVHDLEVAVTTVPSPGDAEPHQADEAYERFFKVVLAVREIVLPEWEMAVGSLISEAEIWAQAAGWITRRAVKLLSEPLLIGYHLPQLYIHAEGLNYLVDPVARFVPGAFGIVDFAVAPSFDRVIIPRLAQGWFVNIERGRTIEEMERRPWCEAAFLDARAWLRQHL